MFFWVKIIQIIVSVLLIVSILLQNRGAGMGGAFGGGAGGISGGAYLTKRGLEKKLYIATIVLAIIFMLLSLVVFLTA